MPADAHANQGSAAEAEDSWERGFVALLRFVDARGTSQVPSRAMAAGIPVGSWAREQRERYWSAQLPSERATRLEQLPDWTWTGLAEQKWRRAFAALRRYVEQHGTATVPPNAVVGEIRLGEWVTHQRAGQLDGCLPPSSAAALQQLPGWQWHPTQDRWADGLAAAQAYVAQHGTADAADGTVIDGFRFGDWMRWCRAEHRAGSLRSDQIAQLESLPGWRWSVAAHRWERGIAALRSYVAAHGSAAPPQGAIIDGFPVGMWVHHRRRQHSTGSLTAERVAELEALPGWQWNVHDARWQHGYALLSRYAAEQGQAAPPADAELDGYPIGRWVRAQRRAHRQDRLRPEWAEALQSMEGWTWSTRPGIAPVRDRDRSSGKQGARSQR